VTEPTKKPEKPADVDIVNDTGWQHQKYSSIPSRGINDYAREIEFAATLTPEQMKAVCRWLESDNCPGWTGVRAQTLLGNKYRFTTTYDSSD
jgi:hypothetical protein